LEQRATKRQKVSEEKQEWFLVFTDYGYFKGLKNGGQLDWTFDYRQAKPLNHPDKVRGIQALLPFGAELLTEKV
jgi:hypothetical protein